MKKNKTFPVIAAKGSAYEIGVIHGSRAKRLVAKSLGNYAGRFKRDCGLDWDKAKRFARIFIGKINEYDPAIMDEIKGVAKGAGTGVDDILALNVRTEIMATGGRFDECTSFAVTPEAALRRETFVGQNWDWQSVQREAVVVLKISQKDRPDITMVTEAGIVGKIGFNSCGVGVCFNALSSRNFNRNGMPAHVILRRILNSGTLSDAIRCISAPGIASSANFMIANAGGGACDVEAEARDFDVLFPDRGVLAHANHFTSLRLAYAYDGIKRGSPATFIRMWKLKNRLELQRGRITVDRIRKALQDHTEYPHSICRHEDEKSREKFKSSTIFSVIMNLTRQKMFIAAGPPCQNTHVAVP